MAMSNTSMRDRIDSAYAARNANYAALSSGEKADMLDAMEAMAEGIIGEIQNAAEVATTVTVTSVSGVTTGAGTSGPGSGSGTGSIA